MQLNVIMLFVISSHMKHPGNVSIERQGQQIQRFHFEYKCCHHFVSSYKSTLHQTVLTRYDILMPTKRSNNCKTTRKLTYFTTLTSNSCTQPNPVVRHLCVIALGLCTCVQYVLVQAAYGKHPVIRNVKSYSVQNGKVDTMAEDVIFVINGDVNNIENSIIIIK